MNTSRRKTLIILGSVALACWLLAAFAIQQRAAEGLPRYTPELFLPGFADKAGNAARIELSGPGGNFAVIRESPTGWVLDRGNFPADYNEVRRTLISLAQLITIAPKTERPDWLTHLSLGTPPQGNGTLVTVKDAQGVVLTQLITGNVVEMGDPNAKGLFVRHPGETRAYLARAVFPVRGDIGSWMTRQIGTIGPARLKSVTILPATGTAFTLGRASADAPVVLEGAPPLMQPNFQLINEIGFAIATFSATDVRAVDSVDFTGAARVVATSFDGLGITFQLVERPDGIWARMRANAILPVMTQEAADINARSGHFAFRLPEQKGRVLLADRLRVLTPLPQRAREGTMPSGGPTPP